MDGLSPELSPDEIAEIERHKYFLSEKAGHDVGWEFAEDDWRAKFSDQEENASDPTSQAAYAGPLGKLLKRLLSRAAMF